MTKDNINFILNNELVSVQNIETNTTVLNYLRNDKKLTTTYSPELLSDLKRYKTSESHNTLEKYLT